MSDPLSGRQLAAFVAAVETGSVQGAADALALTQSAATKRIGALERRLGAPLLERGRFGVRATEAGRTLYPEAKQALAALERAAAALGDEARGARTLRVAASHTIGEFVLPGWLAAFRIEEPDVRVQVEVENSGLVLAALRARRAAIGFVEGLDPLDGFAATTMLRDEIVAVVAAAHPWARRRSVTVRELVRAPFLTREAGSGTRAVAESALAARGVTLRPALEAASSQSLKRAVLDGGFTLISRLAIEEEERAGTLRGVPVSGVALRRDLRAVRLARPEPTGVERRFWRWLAAHGAN